MGTLTNEKWVEVTVQSHPALFKAFGIISHDRGAGAGHACYAVPVEWEKHLATADKVLSTLSDEDLEILSIGEDVEAQLIANSNSELFCTHKMLNSFFEGWN